MLILTTATFSLLLVGVLAVAMTPNRSGMPETVASTVTGIRAVPVSAFTRVSMPMVTPVGDDGFGVTTLDALAGDLDQLEARLPTGEVVVAAVVSTDAAVGLAVVSLPPSVPADGLDLAARQATPDDTVVVHAERPVIIALRDLGGLDVDEGTPVTDDDGRLVGLCTGREEVELRTVAAVPSSPPPSSAVTSEATATTVTAATIEPASSVPAPTATSTPTASAPATSEQLSAPATAPAPDEADDDPGDGD